MFRGQFSRVKPQTFTADQVRVILDGVADDRNRHAWHMALAGMRRGEIAGQRWDDVDLENKVIRIGPTRVDVRGRALDQDDPKTVAAERPLPIPDRLLAELKAARERQATEKLSDGRTTIRGMSYATRPGSLTTPRLSPSSGLTPSVVSMSHRSCCTTRGTPARR